MGEKVCLITGATSGIGKATAMGLANMGATVVMVARDRDKGEAAMAEIEEKSGNASVDLWLADLSSQENIRRLCPRFTIADQQPLQTFGSLSEVRFSPKAVHSLTLSSFPPGKLP